MLFVLVVILLSMMIGTSFFLSGPQIQVDESSYLLSAATIAGQLTVSGVNGYNSGYSALLVPAFWITNDPKLAYHIALIINALLIATTPFALFSMLRRLFPAMTSGWLTAASIAATCHTSVLLLSQHTMSESALIPLYALLAAAGTATLAGATSRSAVLTGLAAGALFLVHQRGAILAAPMLSIIAWNARTQAALRRPAFLALSAFVVVAFLHAPLEHLAAKRLGLAGAYPIGDTVDALLIASNWIRVAINALGATTEAAVASFGVAVIGGVAITAGLRGTPEGALRPSSKAALLALIAGALVAILMSAVFFVPAQRIDQTAYGRYALPTVLPVIAIGALQFSKPAYARVRLVSIAAIVTIACVAAMGFEVPRLLPAVSGWSFINSPTLYLAQSLSSAQWAWYSIGAFTAVGVALIGAGAAISARLALAMFALLSVVAASWLWIGITRAHSALYATNRHVVEAVHDFESVTGEPLCVKLADAVIGWHGVDLRWRNLPAMSDHVGRRTTACVQATIDYLDGHSFDDIAKNAIAVERPPPAMDQAVALFVEHGAARDRWRALRPPFRSESFVPMDETDRKASTTLRAAPPRTLRVGDTMVVNVDIRNDGSHTIWPAEQDGPRTIWLGARTFAKGSTTTIGEFRTRLTTDVAPGVTTPLAISIGPFHKPGAYRVGVGMLQEGVAWFGDEVSFDVDVESQ